MQTTDNPADEVLSVEQNYIGRLREEKTSDDPMVVRWGFNPGQRGIPNNPLKTGINAPYIPVGKFFAHAPFETPREYCTIDEFKPHEFIATVSASEAQLEISNALLVWGYQTFFYGVTDAALVTVINHVILPELSKIRRIFGKGSPVPKECPGADEYDSGEPREYCPTCLLAWLNSDALTLYIEQIEQNGFPVNALEGNRYVVRTITPSVDDLETVRNLCRVGLQTYIRKANDDWATVVSELDNKVRNKLNVSEHLLRKDIHQPKPQNKESETAARTIAAGQEQTNDVIEQMAKTSEQNQEMMLALAKQNAETQRQMAEFMKMFGSALMMPPPEDLPEPAAEEVAPPEVPKTPKGKTKAENV